MRSSNRVTILNLLSTVLLQGISIISGPIFSRLLGTSGYGILSTYNIWVSILAIVCSLQTQATMANSIVDFPEEEQKRYQSSVMVLSLLTFVACGIIVGFLIAPISRLLDLSAGLIGLMFLQAFGTFCVSFLNCKYTYELKAGRNLLISVGVALSTFGLALLLVVTFPADINYLGRILGNALVYGILGIVSCCLILRQGRHYIDKRYWKYCLIIALPMVFYNLSDLILGHSDLVMLRAMRGDSAAGIYGYAFNFGTIIFMIFRALDNSWKPYFMKDMKAGRIQEIVRQEKNYLELFTVLAIGFVLLCREVFLIYARSDFWDGIPVIIFVVCGYYLNFLCTFPVNFEVYHKKTNVIAGVTITASILNLGLNYLFILRFGIVGAAIATMMSHGLQYAFHFVYSRFVLGKNDYPFGTLTWLPYGLCFFAAAATGYQLPNLWYVRWGLGAVVGVWELLRIRKRKNLL